HSHTRTYTLSLHDALPISRTSAMDAWAFACHGPRKIPGRRSSFAKGEPSDRTAHHRLRTWFVLHSGGRPRGRSALVSVDRGSHRSEEHTSELQSRFDLVCR